jgi:hypothetical protein
VSSAEAAWAVDGRRSASAARTRVVSDGECMVADYESVVGLECR